MAIPLENKVYMDALKSPSWVSLGEDNSFMDLGDGFAMIGNKRMYAERTIPAAGASDVANITGVDKLDIGSDIKVVYNLTLRV